jgi:hypothetical protein
MKAFPTAVNNGHSENQDGMELRDYFAAKVLNASWISSLDDLTRGEVKDIATTCYIIADAMMKARLGEDKND